VSKSTGTPDFIAYREADIQILSSQISDELLAKAKIFHTTCFALSKNPARTTIVESAVRAKSLGLQTSIDINFSERIWPDREEAKQVLKAYLATDPLVKLSEDDCFRLFAEEQSEAFIFEFFHGLGATTICLTKGKDGVVLSDKIHGIFHQNATQLDNIKDTTGAGDAFWTGFLYARLLQKDFEESITIAQKLAVLKLQSVGKLPDGIDIPAYLHSNN
jgi:fructokinase